MQAWRHFAILFTKPVQRTKDTMEKNYVKLQGKLETFPQPFHPHLSSRHRSKAARTAAASRSGSSSGGRSSSLPCWASGCFRGRSTIQMGFQPIHSHTDLHATNPLINLSIQIPSTTEAHPAHPNKKHQKGHTSLQLKLRKGVSSPLSRARFLSPTLLKTSCSSPTGKKSLPGIKCC